MDLNCFFLNDLNVQSKKLQPFNIFLDPAILPGEKSAAKDGGV